MKFLLFFLTLFLTGTVNEPDGNVPLHEKTETRMPDYSTEKGYFDDVRTEPVVTWVFEEGTFVPAAKLTEKEQYSIATNYLGTPEAMYREDGETVWTCELNSYGKVRNWQGEIKTDCPFRYQGQYEDAETGLYYNRFRYYSPEEGMYLSQDPIGLHGGTQLYSYVHNSNSWVDRFGFAPITDTVDFTGHPDLYQGIGKNTVTIILTGDRSSDFTRAFKESGISKTDAVGYTWHHVADFNPATGESTMQLIKTSTHEANLPHKGSAGQFADYFGVQYDTYEAKLKAYEQGWRDEPKQRPKKVTCN
jgi:RHS repeat-associated protein